MDFDNPVIARLFEREYGQKLAKETKRFNEALEQAETARREAEAEAETARREAEAEAETARREAEAEAMREWQELMFKLLGHRFKTLPVDFFMLLQSIPVTQRSRVSDIIFDAPDVEQCLQALQQLRKSSAT